MKEFLKGAIYANFFISICASCLTAYCNLFLFEKLPSKELTLFVFFSTLFAYNFHRKVGGLYKQNTKLSRREVWFRSNGTFIKGVIFISFGASIYLLYYLPKEVFALLFPLGFISIFYILEINKIPSLRKIPFFKIFVIAFVWGGVAVFLPLLFNKGQTVFSLYNQLFALTIALFVFAETLPFDIRDMDDDQLNQLKTIPRRIGIKKTKLLSSILLTLSFISFIFLNLNSQVDWICIISFGLSILYSGIWIYMVRINRSEYFYSIGVESILCMPLVFYFLLLIID